MRQNTNDVIGGCDQCQRRKTLTAPTKDTTTKSKRAVLFEVIFVNFKSFWSMNIEKYEKKENKLFNIFNCILIVSYLCLTLALTYPNNHLK